MENSTGLVNATGLQLSCQAQRNWFIIGFMPLDAIAIILNLGLLIAATIDKEKLQRQNYTLASVNSALLSNSIHLALKLWAASANAMARDSPRVLGVPKTVWTVCESGAAAIVFCVVANASSVIYVTLDNTYVTSRSGRSLNKNLLLPTKKKIAASIIAISWIIPIAFIAVSTLVWNCSAECWCPSSSFQGDVCPHDYRCSRLATPLPTAFLLVNAALWALQLLALVAMIVMKYRDFSSSLTPHQSIRDSETENDSKMASESAQVQSQSVDQPPNTSYRRKRNMSARIKLNPRFQMAVLLTGILIVCFIPKAVAIIIDSVNPNANLKVPMMISSICLYLYTVSFPFVLLKYLPNLKDSLSRMLMRITNPC